MQIFCWFYLIDPSCKCMTYNAKIEKGSKALKRDIFITVYNVNAIKNKSKYMNKIYSN